MKPAALRNLLLVHPTEAFDIRDFHEIKRIVDEQAPDIEVFIASETGSNVTTRNRASHRPTLIFCPTILKRFSPRRGKIYCGKVMPKPEQMRRLQAGGLMVPKWTLLGPHIKLDEADWGPVVVVKPSAWKSSHGKGIKWMRTGRVKYVSSSVLPPEHPAKAAPFIVQKYVNTGPSPTKLRILSLFGNVLYAMLRTATDDLPPLDSEDEVIESARIISTGKATAELIDRPEVHQIAAKAYGAIPSVPLQALDVLIGTDGVWYALEINPGGNTWHFSSSYAVPYERELGGRKLKDQFGAFTVAAKALIGKTRAEAE
jgi:hypothetical protein